MTFSICVREPYIDEESAEHRSAEQSSGSNTRDSDEQTRYGVAVTTRLAGVGTLCPFASENGAVATQSLVNVDLGRKGVEYLDDGLGVEDALEALLNADEGRPGRQLHGVGADGEFAFSGEECKPWFGHTVGDTYTVAGNLLTGPEVLAATVEAYESSMPTREEPADAPLAERLIDALAAGHAEGGDKREELHVQSAALLVRTTEDREMDPYYNDLRVDATETPLADLRETYELASEGFEMAVERYADAYEEDEDAGS